MTGRFSGALAVLLLQPQNAIAQYKKVGPDKRTAAQIAEDECAAQASGSGKVIAGTIIAGVIGMAIARDSYIKDCMKTRGYERVARQKAVKDKKPAKPDTRNNFFDGSKKPARDSKRN